MQVFTGLLLPEIAFDLGYQFPSCQERHFSIAILLVNALAIFSTDKSAGSLESGDKGREFKFSSISTHIAFNFLSVNEAEVPLRSK